MRKSIFLILAMTLTMLSSFAQSPEQAAAYYNQAMVSLYTIETYNSRAVLIEEYDKLMFDLSYEKLGGMKEFVSTEFSNLGKTIGDIKINDMERERVKKMASKKMSNALKKAIANSLTPTMVGQNWKEMVFSVVKSAAQAAVNYNLIVDEIKE